MAIEHQDLYPDPSVRRGTLSNLNCMCAEKSSGGGGGSWTPPVEVEPAVEPCRSGSDIMTVKRRDMLLDY